MGPVGDRMEFNLLIWKQDQRTGSSCMVNIDRLLALRLCMETLIKIRPEDRTSWYCGFPVHRYFPFHVLLWICTFPWNDIWCLWVYCTALVQQMRFWQSVYYNPSPLNSLSTFSLISTLAHRQLISSTLISWPIINIYIWNFRDMIIGSFILFWLSPHSVLPYLTTEQPKGCAQSSIRAIPQCESQWNDIYF